MVRPFARKKERPTLTTRNDEFGWWESPDANEVSPASVWAFEDEAPSRNDRMVGGSSEKKQNRVDEAEWIEPSDPQDDSSWWSQPDLTEEPVPEILAAPEIEEASPSEIQAAPIELKEELPQIQEAPPEIKEPEVLYTAPEPSAVRVEPASVFENEHLEPHVEEPALPTRPRVLDESVILPHEASFATVALHQKTFSKSYSPTREFTDRFTFGLKKYSPVLLLILVFAAAIAYSLKFKSLDDTIPSGAIQHATAAPVLPQTTNTPISTSQPETETAVKAKPAPDNPSEVEIPASPSLGTSPVAVKVAANASDKPEPAPKSKPKVAQSVRPAAKSTDITRPDLSSSKVGPDNSPVQRPPEKRAVSNGNAEPKTGESETDKKVVPSGGAERPRRVNSQSNSQNNSPGTQPQKPKLIDWP